MNSIRRTHSAVVRLGFGMAILFLFLPVPATSQALEWEVVNPFRFIVDQPSIEVLKKANASVNSAEGLERALQKLDEEKIDNERKADLRKCFAEGKPEDTCKNEIGHSYLGWFAGLAKDNYKKTCWDAENLVFSKEKCPDYIKPTKHRVRVWLPTLVGPDFSDATWLGDGMQLSEQKNCDRSIYKFPCIEFDAEYIYTKPGGTTVSLNRPDGSIIAKTPKPILVKDNLIVGLGDSYASGEGNPDIPASFLDKQSDVDFAYFWKWRRMPRKDKNSGVAWLDTRCHRSMYSYQFKTALQFALNKKQEAVTFVSYSCSGGTTDTIISKTQKAKEKMQTGVDNVVRPQLEVLRKVLQGREVDYLLLSTGGNDLHFAEYVANIIMSGRTRLMLKVFHQALSPSEKETIDGIAKLQDNYAKLQKTLFTPSTGIAIRGCKKEEPCRRIILTAYPDYFQDENDKPCAANRDEFTIPFNEDEGREKRAGSIKELFATKLFEFQRKTDIDTGSEPTRWTLATSHLDRYSGRGFCAQGRSQGMDATNKPMPLSVDENFMMLRRRDHNWYARDWARDEIVRNYDPRNYKAYGLRQRWIRLPVDSKMTTDEQKRFLNWFSYDLFFLDDRSTVMHPTAHALAVHADANIKKIDELEGPAKP
ncbi:MAG: hypothetical protein DMF63_01450 [Acidobacteria bacterium]|nr:MAG: hypothetical protein DMF63_01450 [Acidobacteriota bacterium]